MERTPPKKRSLSDSRDNTKAECDSPMPADRNFVSPFRGLSSLTPSPSPSQKQLFDDTEVFELAKSFGFSKSFDFSSHTVQEFLQMENETW